MSKTGELQWRVNGALAELSALESNIESIARRLEEIRSLLEGSDAPAGGDDVDRVVVEEDPEEDSAGFGRTVRDDF